MNETDVTRAYIFGKLSEVMIEIKKVIEEHDASDKTLKALKKSRDERKMYDDLVYLNNVLNILTSISLKTFPNDYDFPEFPDWIYGWYLVALDWDIDYGYGGTLTYYPAEKVHGDNG